MPPKKPTKNSVFDLPISMVLYGPSGSGKTSFAAHFPRCGFICDSQEQGIVYLAHRDLVPQPSWIETFEVDDNTSWPKLISRIQKAAIDSSIDTLVVESLTGLENMCFLYHCKEHFNDNWDGTEGRGGFFQYARGPESASRLEIPKFLTALNTCLKGGKNVILTAHSFEKQDMSPDGTEFLKHTPYATKHVWQRIHRWAVTLLFLGTKFEEDKSVKGLKKVAKPDMDRLIYTEGTPTCAAKNWLGLKGVIPMGSSGKQAYENFLKALQ